MTGSGTRTAISVVLAFLIFSLWTADLLLLFQLDIGEIPFWLLPPAILWHGYVNTGLFITAHDSMHGSILPANRKLNNLVGIIAVTLYALFSYGKLREKHWEHHRNPATDKDPDYHDGKHVGFFLWYFRFMKKYLTIPQLIGMALIFSFFTFILSVPLENVILFWIIPAILSTFQLFYFGTFLPHREPEGGYTNRHHAKSNPYPYFISLATCYHFGYHLEHHVLPDVQWWLLPKARSRWKRKKLNVNDLEGIPGARREFIKNL
jgi:beta-carotene ketolase (CrtW type)